MPSERDWQSRSENRYLIESSPFGLEKYIPFDKSIYVFVAIDSHCTLIYYCFENLIRDPLDAT